MKFYNSSVKKVLLISVLTIVLFTASVITQRQGNYVMNAVNYGDSEYRDYRGIPVVFLKRALADNECEVSHKESTECLPVSWSFVTQDQRQVSHLYLFIDLIFWFVVTVVVMKLIYTFRNYEKK